MTGLQTVLRERDVICRTPASDEGSLKLIPVGASSVMGTCAGTHGAGEVAVLGAGGQGFRNSSTA